MRPWSDANRPLMETPYTCRRCGAKIGRLVRPPDPHGPLRLVVHDAVRVRGIDRGRYEVVCPACSAKHLFRGLCDG